MFFSLQTPLLLFFSLLLLFFAGAQANHQCTSNFSEFAKARNTTRCQKLTTLGVELAWSTPLNHGDYNSFNVIFGAVLDEDEEVGWLAWGVNPGLSPQMVGTRAAIGIKKENNSLWCMSYNITMETRMGCRLRPVVLEELKCNRFEYDPSLKYHVVYAALNLSTAEYNVSKLNIVWQMGYEVGGDEPKKHPATLQNVDSIESLNLLTGGSSTINGLLRIRLRKWHGILNMIGWGTLLPLGVIIARYFRRFPFGYKSVWFYVHVSCQMVGYVLGVVGWGIGLWLGHASNHYVFLSHRILAMLIFSLTTLQVFALRLRPDTSDEFRKLWDIYHHFLGYALVAMIVANIFRGIEILKPENKNWKWAFVGILISLASITLILEYYTWKSFIRQRRRFLEKPLPQPQVLEEDQDFHENRPCSSHPLNL